MTPSNNLILRLQGGLVVSCQAAPDEPLFGAGHMAAMARAALAGGAVGIRANGPEDIAAIREAVDLPVIGIYKVDLPGFAVRITPTVEYARQVSRAGAHIIALDATRRPHPDGLGLTERIRAVTTALATVKEPVTATELAKRFARARAADVGEILETLCTMGKARRGPSSDKATAGQTKVEGTFLP